LEAGTPTIENNNNRETYPSTNDDKRLNPKNCKPQQQVQQLAKLKNNKPFNNHEEIELQVHDLNFAKLNQTTTRIMERSSEQGSSTQATMSTMNETVR
jgi:hypothetical protein